jgi:hypothetical protein
MMIYQEKIAPPLAALTEEEEMKLKRESIAREDRWVRNIIDRLADIAPNAKHGCNPRSARPRGALEI